MSTPPDWFSDWYTFLVVQLAGIVAAGIAVWKWLTKPMREEHKKTARRLRILKRIFKRESFSIRTAATSIQGMAVKNEKRIDLIEHRLNHLQVSADRVQATLDEGLTEIRDRLIGVETELRIRVEHHKSQTRGSDAGDSGRNR